MLTFKGAGTRGSAVFMRGLTAWIVLQNAPPLDATKLRAQLGRFPDGGRSDLRQRRQRPAHHLKQPAQIAALADGSESEGGHRTACVTERRSPSASPATRTIRRASLSTLLPGADTSGHADRSGRRRRHLTVIPATPGRAMLAAARYAEFAALQTRRGLVFTPYVDDLSVSVERDARHHHPSRRSGADAAADAGERRIAAGAGRRRRWPQSYLDFAAWRHGHGGSFLATERRLRAAAARLRPEDANPARLALARFYLANDFAAEALGLIKLMQAQIPRLRATPSFSTMRAAAELHDGPLSRRP